MRVVDAERLVFTPAHVYPVRDARLCASGAQRREGRLWIGAVGSIGDVHAI